MNVLHVFCIIPEEAIKLDYTSHCDVVELRSIPRLVEYKTNSVMNKPMD
jgi:hypothetical protein